MSYPRRKDLFDAWYKAMVAGATVDKPNYGKKRGQKGGKAPSRTRRNASRRMRRSRRIGRRKMTD